MLARRSYPHYLPAADHTSFAIDTVPSFVQDTEVLLQLPDGLVPGASFSVDLVTGVQTGFSRRYRDRNQLMSPFCCTPADLSVCVLDLPDVSSSLFGLMDLAPVSDLAFVHIFGPNVQAQRPSSVAKLVINPLVQTPFWSSKTVARLLAR